MRPWYVTGKCVSCDDTHDFGPYASREEALAFANELADHTDMLASEMKVEERDPLTDDQLLGLVNEVCTRELVRLTILEMLTQTTGGKTESDYSKIATTIQAATIRSFCTYRPGASVEDMHRVLGGVEFDNIGKVDGHA
ncbi:hypothetical protein N9980_00825 [bacterium]|nr:hypothetical protein [bacterium]